MSSPEAFSRFEEATQRLRPEIALVLGSGMGEVVRDFHREQIISFRDIPGLGETTVAGHRGQLALGNWAGKPVLVFEGRLHFYEGHSWEKVVTPVRTAHSLGVRALVMTNAAGGIHDSLGPGSLMVIRDHIEWTRPYCWRLPGPGGLGPSRASPYSPRLAHLLIQAGKDAGMSPQEGIYAALTGPSYETPAEIRALKTWGADAVGMSTAREIQTGHDLGLECAALSCITNRAAGLSAGPLDHKEVLATAAQQSERLGHLFESFLRLL